MDCMPMSGRSVGQLLDLYPNIVRFGLKMTELEPRMSFLPSSIELSGAYSRHAYNTLEKILKCTIVLSICVPFGSAKIGQTAICNFGKDQVIARQNSTLGFAKPYQGPMLSAVLDDNNPKDGTDNSSDYASRDPPEDLDLSVAPEYLQKQIRDMLKTHSSMWDGTLRVIRATEHASVTPPDALLIRAQPYRTGPFKRQIIADQINKMLKLNVIRERRQVGRGYPKWVECGSPTHVGCTHILPTFSVGVWCRLTNSACMVQDDAPSRYTRNWRHKRP